MKGMFLGAALLAMSGCTQKDAAPIVCDVLFKSVTAAAGGVAGALGCANVPAVAATLSQPVMSLKLCSEQASGLVGDAVCGKVVDTIMSIGLSQLPADWKCTGGSVGDKAKEVLTAKCKEAVPF
jgi:hypothetical protein